MFHAYLVLNVNDEQVLYLYLNNYEEFSNEFNNNLKKENLYDDIANYIKKHKVNFNGKKVMFVVNDLIIGSLTLTSSVLSSINNNIKPYPFLNIWKNYIIKNNTNTSNIKKNKQLEYRILIKTNRILEKVLLNDYLVSVISTKIPATYDIEAIKTIAVLTRTNIFKNLYENKYIDNKNNVYPNIITLQNIWKNDFTIYYNRIKKAVIETDNEYLYFHNYFLNTTPTKINEHYIVGINTSGINLLAKSGYNYKQILNHYYPNARIIKL